MFDDCNDCLTLGESLEADLMLMRRDRRIAEYAVKLEQRIAQLEERVAQLEQALEVQREAV